MVATYLRIKDKPRVTRSCRSGIVFFILLSGCCNRLSHSCTPFVGVFPIFLSLSISCILLSRSQVFFQITTQPFCLRTLPIHIFFWIITSTRQIVCHTQNLLTILPHLFSLANLVNC